MEIEARDLRVLVTARCLGRKRTAPNENAR